MALSATPPAPADTASQGPAVVELADTAAPPSGTGETPADTSAPAADPPAPLPEAVARDWIQGDTILGFFVQAPGDTVAGGAAESVDAPGVDPAGQPEAGETVLERIVVVGGEGPALSLYRLAQEGDTGRPSINFMKATRIILFMEQGDVARVEAEGPIEGIYLDPAAAPPGDGGTVSEEEQG